ncbi:MAG: hypothetical protein QW041_03560 [Candidatus Pacearchaeota archaeon]
MFNSEEKLIQLLKTITRGKSKPFDEWEITALLETNGLRDIDAINDWNEPDLFSLAKRLVKYVDSIEYEEKEIKKEGLKFTRLFKNYIKGALFAFPMFIQILAMVIIGFGIWSSIEFTLKDATAIGLATLLALATTGGLAQIIGRKGLFYLKFEEYLLAAQITKRLYILGLIFIVILCISFTLINFYFKLFPTYMFQIFIIYYFLLSLLFLIFSVFYMIESYGIIAIMTFLGILIVYILFIVLKLNLILSQAIGLIAVIIISKIIALFKMQKLRKKSETEGALLPNFPSLFYSLYPYFIYGTAYFLFLIMDRTLAWTTSKTYLPYFIWFNYPYEVGVDWALIPLIITIALIEVFIYELGFFAFKKINEIEADVIRDFNKYFLRIYKVAGLTFIIFGIISIILSFLLPYLFKNFSYFFQFIDVFFNNINIFVFWFASIGYVLLSWSLLNCIIFFAYSRHEFALKAILIGLITNFIIGYILSRSYNYYFSVVGLTAGALVFAIISTYYAYNFFKNYDYYYYSSY